MTLLLTTALLITADYADKQLPTPQYRETAYAAAGASLALGSAWLVLAVWIFTETATAFGMAH